jgi:HAE1 family hydrophobic/amphiphilic exporter-1
MKYMISDATSAGEATIQVVFEQGTDPNAGGRQRATASTR